MGIFITRYGNFNLNLLILIDIVVIYILWGYGQAQNNGDKKAEIYFREKLRKRLVIAGIGVMILRGLELKSYLEICTYVLFIVCGSLVIGEAKKRFVSR